MSEIKALEKLREYAAYNCRVKGWKDDLKALADGIEAEVAERFIELPCDADGVPIHMGDVVEGELLFGNATVRGTVYAYYISDDDELGTVYIRVKLTEDTWTIKELRFKRCRHVKPRTLEDVLCDALADVSCAGDGIRRKFEPDEPYVTGLADEIRAMFGEVDCTLVARMAELGLEADA